jgi:hypothetical protein
MFFQSVLFDGLNIWKIMKDIFHRDHSLFDQQTLFGLLSVSASIAQLNIKWSLSKGRHREDFINLLGTNTLTYLPKHQ